MMVEGVSILAIARMTRTSKNSIVKLLADTGEACSEHQDRTRDLPCERVPGLRGLGVRRYEAEERLGREEGHAGLGDVWTWTSICADTKIVPAWFVDYRDQPHARAFMLDLASRMSGRTQLTSDGFRPDKDAMADAFAGEVD